jgi:hypothetical protein
MNDTFDLPVRYKGEELLFPATLRQLGYTHRFEVCVGDELIFFERDEEGAYRALVSGDHQPADLKPELLQAIADGIEAVLK